jgi:hypothetical protein
MVTASENKNYKNIFSYAKTLSSGGGHLGFPIHKKNLKILLLIILINKMAVFFIYLCILCIVQFSALQLEISSFPSLKYQTIDMHNSTYFN